MVIAQLPRLKPRISGVPTLDPADSHAAMPDYLGGLDLRPYDPPDIPVITTFDETWHLLPRPPPPTFITPGELVLDGQEGAEIASLTSGGGYDSGPVWTPSVRGMLVPLGPGWVHLPALLPTLSDPAPLAFRTAPV